MQAEMVRRRQQIDDKIRRHCDEAPSLKSDLSYRLIGKTACSSNTLRARPPNPSPSPRNTSDMVLVGVIALLSLSLIIRILWSMVGRRHQNVVDIGHTHLFRRIRCSDSIYDDDHCTSLHHIILRRTSVRKNVLQTLNSSITIHKGEVTSFGYMPGEIRRIMIIKGYLPDRATQSFSSIYSFYDDLLRFASEVAAINPSVTILWEIPPHLAFLTDDMRRLHHFLIARYVSSERHIFAVSFADSSANPDDCISFVYSFLKMHSNTLGRSFDASILEIISALPVVRPIGPLNQSLVKRCRKYLNTRKYDPQCHPKPGVLLPVLVTGLGGSGTHFISKSMFEMGLQLPHETLGIDGSVCWMYAVNDLFDGNSSLSASLCPRGSAGAYPHRAFIKKRSFWSPRFRRVVMLVRTPARHIASLTSHLPSSFAFIQRHMATLALGGKKEGDRGDADCAEHIPAVGCRRGGSCNLAFAVWAWATWSGHVSSYADAIYRMEDQLALLKRHICDIFSCQATEGGHLSLQSVWKMTFPEVKKSSKAHSVHGNYSWADISEIADRSTCLSRALNVTRLAFQFGYVT